MKFPFRISKKFLVLECTTQFNPETFRHLLFDKPTDIQEIEFWEDHLKLIGQHYALVQVEKKYVAGIKVLGYNLLMESRLEREGLYGA